MNTSRRRTSGQRQLTGILQIGAPGPDLDPWPIGVAASHQATTGSRSRDDQALPPSACVRVGLSPAAGPG